MKLKRVLGVSFFLVSALALTNCASHSVGDTTSEDQVVLTAHPFMAPTLREVAYVHSALTEGEATFNSIMQQERASAAFIDEVDRFYALMLKANESIDTFDKELDEILDNAANGSHGEPLESPTYRRIVKMWQLHDRMKAEIVDVFKHLLAAGSNQDSESGIRSKANHVLNNFDSYLAKWISSDLSRKLELHELLQEMLDAKAEYAAASNTNSGSGIFRGAFGWGETRLEKAVAGAGKTESEVAEELHNLFEKHRNSPPKALSDVEQQRKSVFEARIEQVHHRKSQRRNLCCK